jgi:hypothetical protein
MALRGPATTRRGRVGVEAAGVAGVLVLAVMWVRLAGTSPLLYQGGLFACSLAAVAVIAAATHPSEGPVAKALSARPLVLLGIISYGVYLYHWPIFLWLDQAGHLQGWSLLTAKITVTLAVSVASFIFVERPIRQGGLRWPRSLVVVPTTAAVVIGSLIVVTAPYVPVSATVSRPDSLHAVTDSIRTQSEPQGRLLLVGNSVPFFLAREGFEALKTRPPLHVLNGAFPICAFPPEATANRLNQSDGNNYSRPSGARKAGQASSFAERGPLHMGISWVSFATATMDSGSDRVAWIRQWFRRHCKVPSVCSPLMVHSSSPPAFIPSTRSAAESMVPD